MDALLDKAADVINVNQGRYHPVLNRVAYVVSHGRSYASNGYAIRTHGIAKALNHHGMEALCFVRPGRPWDMGKDKHSVLPEVEVEGVRYIHSRWADDRKPSGEEHKFIVMVKTLVELFKVYRPQVVMAASNHEVALPALVAARQLGLPFHYEVRGFWEVSRASRQPGWEESQEFKEHYERECWVISRANRLYTLNTQMTDELIKRGARAELIDLVPNSVSGIPKWSKQTKVRQYYGIPANAYVLGYMGAITEYEGLEQILEALKLLKDKNVYALLVGGYSPVTRLGRVKAEPIVQNLQQLAKSYGIAKQVIFTGRVDYDKLPEYFAAVDATVISRPPLEVCELVSAIKPLEYMSFGKPIIASSVAPQAELLEQGRLGWLFEKGDPEDFARVISELRSADEITVAKRVEAALQAVREKFVWNKSVWPMAQRLTGGARREKPFTNFHRYSGQKRLSVHRQVVDGEVQRAKHLYFRQGNISQALELVLSLEAQSAELDNDQRDFLGVLKGQKRLEAGWSVPPRQPNPGLFTRRKHLLYCLHQSVPHSSNGYATRSHGIAVGLQQAGWVVQVATRPGFPWDTGAEGFDSGYHEAVIDGVSYRATAGWNLKSTPLDFYLAEAADQYCREAQNSGAEVIVAASNYITALPALVAARRLGIPFVYEVRGLWEITQASTEPEWEGSERFEQMKRLEAQVAKEADLLLTLTDELADELVARGADRARISVAPNAVDTGKFFPREAPAPLMERLSLDLRVPVIGYAGSVVGYEGLDLLLDSLGQLKADGVEFQFVLVGDGKVVDQVQSRASELGIGGQCRFTGRVPFEDVPDYLACMDVIPVPRLSSAVTEMVSPLKPLEAMAMGKAVVLSDVAPHKVFAGDNQRARLFDKNSAGSLTSALKELLSDRDQRAQLGNAALEWIREHRTWEIVTRYYGDVLDACVLQEKARASAKTRNVADVTLGLIADQFTTDTLTSAVKVLPLSVNGWREELHSQPIDALFLESAWKGNDGQWHRRVGYYSDEEFEPLEALLTYCREQGIPTLFWNKEDPVHFERFRAAAALCDHVFTTDSRRIIPYLSTPNAVTKTASSCPFFASPKIHNPLPSTRPWANSVAYGGTYYGKRYPERTEYMDKIMSAAAPIGLTIYDRQHDDPASPYQYPQGLSGHVAGGLPYEEMIQAYKAHPAQVNVNSVLDSPTMFSRRVMEVAASGTPVISGPAIGMNRYLDGTALVVDSEAEAAEAIEAVMENAGYRWRLGLHSARAVMRAHTTGHRLAQMLRTTGMVLEAPDCPKFGVMTERLSEKSVDRLLAQTLRPVLVMCDTHDQTLARRLEQEGIQCCGSRAVNVDERVFLATPEALEAIEPEDFEDLAWTTAYSPYPISAFNRQVTAGNQWPGVASDLIERDPGLQLVHVLCEGIASVAALRGWVDSQKCLALRKPSEEHAQLSKLKAKPTLLIAGHDLKFIKPFYPYFRQAGYRVLLDFWKGHNQHDEGTSRRLLEQADVIFCEWMLGNAIWYAAHVKSGQNLVGRLHAQEIRSDLFDRIPFEFFSKVVFVAPHMLRAAIERNPELAEKGVVVFNGVDVESLRLAERKATDSKVLGMVGVVPRSKRLDKALDILKELRRKDLGYTLRIKGKLPHNFPWMKDRPEEMDWYERQYRRLEEDSLLRNAVMFDPHGNDMPEWYSGVDYVLSPSDHESFHLTVADGAAAGCQPVVLNWEGAKELYPKEWVYDDVASAVHGIRQGRIDENVRQYSEEHFAIPVIAKKLIGLVESKTDGGSN